jgi:hypothetical protein
MTKRARYDGPGPINVFAPEDTYLTDPIAVNLESGQLLPTETVNGDPVPAKLRDELLKSDDWTEVNQADQLKSNEKDGGS